MPVYKELEEKILSFKNQNNGLGLPGECPPTNETITTACHWAKIGYDLGLDIIEAIPGDTNFILITYNKEDVFVDIDITNNIIDYIEVQKGIGLKFDVLLDIDKPDNEKVIEILNKLAKNELK